MWLAAFGLLVVALYLLPMGSLPRALGIQVLGLLLSGLTLIRGWLRARRDPDARMFGVLLAGFGALSLLYRFGLLQRLLTYGAGLAVHPLRDALLWNLALGLLLAALMDLGRRLGPRDQALPRVLDGLIFATAFYLLLWVGLLRPYLEASAVPLAFAFSSQVLFALTAGALGVALHLLLRQGNFRGPLPALATALACLAIIFPWSLAASFHHSYPLDHPARFLGLLSFLAVLLAVDRPLESSPIQNQHRWVDLLPYAPAALAILGFLVHLLSPDPRIEPFALGLLATLALLVLLRQGLTVLEVEHLNQTLELKVEARTREVAERNALLLRTQGMNLVATLGAGIAHDLNNLVGSAMLEADLLAAPTSPLGPGLAPEVKLLQSTLVRAGDLTQRLMRMGRVADAPTVLDAGAHVRGLAPMLRALVPRSHPLSVDVAEGPLPLACTPSQLDQIIVNLVVNARDALPPQGSIQVSLGPGAGGGVQLQVSDTGSGIPDEVLQRIFEPFFTTKAPGQGTGLGLGSVKAVVEGLGGELSLRTQVGQGTCFTIWLPSPEA
jgi:signal transduction histidine kinase